MEATQVLLIALQLAALLVAVIFHEVAHGYVAFRLGDPTAKARKRLSFNPVRHIDPIGTIVLPGLLALAGAPVFGFAKPVPVNPMYFKNPYRGMMWVAVAGPLTNFSLAALTYAVLGGLNLVFPIDPLTTFETMGVLSFFVFFLMIFFIINIILGMFNLVPIPPLDGSRVLAYLLPEGGRRWLRKIEPFGFLIVLGLLLIGALEHVLNPLYEWAIWALSLL